MKNRSVVVGGFAAVMVVLVWYFMVFSGMSTKSSDIQSDISTAEGEQASLRSRLTDLEQAEADLPEMQARLVELQAKVAAEPNLAEFIEQADVIKAEAGVEWVTVAPGLPSQAGPVASTSLTLEVEGGYFEVLDYLRRLEDLSRLVVIDGIVLTAGQAESTTPGVTPDESEVADGPPRLHAALTARMFSISAMTGQAAPTANTAAAVATETVGG